ncbi:MAG: hypothetical protein ACFCVG_13370 [Kineosporiaceae bacterium]
MLLSDWRVLLRRWYVVLAGLAVTAALCLGAATWVPARYDAVSTVLLLPPETVVDGRPTNPYLGLGGLDGMADVLSTAMTDAAVQQAVADEGLTVEYGLGRDLTQSGPVIVVQVTGRTRDEALRAQQFLLDRLPGRLDALQEAVDVRPAARITSTVITQDEVPEVNRRTQTRVLLVAAAGGLAVTYLLAALVDGIVSARRRAGRPAAAVPVRAAEPGGPAGSGSREPTLTLFEPGGRRGVVGTPQRDREPSR